ncbi:MAG: hypothetical protein ACK5SI_07265, partial [Planctomycetia bacterium]
MIRDASGRITRVRYSLPRHKAANWVGPGRGRTSTRPGANGVVELSPFEFLDRLADLVPPPPNREPIASRESFAKSIGISSGRLIAVTTWRGSFHAGAGLRAGFGCAPAKV